MDDVYLSTFSDDLKESIKKKVIKSTNKLDKGDNDLEEKINRLTKQKEFLQEQLRKAGAEIKFLKAEVNYERELRIGGTKYHANT